MCDKTQKGTAPRWRWIVDIFFNEDGVAETAVRRIQEGTSAELLQSGLDEKWWADSMEFYCYLRNIQDLLTDEKNTL